MNRDPTGVRDHYNGGVDPSEDAGARDFRLGPWLVRPRLNRISSSAQTRRLEPKLMDLLACLAAHPGVVLSKQQLVDSVWERQFITDTAISRAIASLRRALGDDAHEPRFIETISKRGYRLIVAPAPVAELPPEPSAAPAAGDRPSASPAAVVPYVVGQWVRGRQFYGRREQIAEILDGNRNALWLLGTRRLGKTSLLKQVEHLAAVAPEPRYLPLYWDLEGAGRPADLHLDFGEALLDAEERLAAAGVALEEVADDDLFVSLGRLRRALRERELRLLLLCDEAEALLALDAQDPAVLPKLRRALQSRADVRSVLASSLRLWALAEQPGDTSPFLHGFIPPLYLGTLSDDEARALIRQSHLPAEARPELDDLTVERIRELCGNHPYLTQLAAKRYGELADLDEVCEQVASDDMVAHFFAVDFELLSEPERWVLRRVAEREGVEAADLAAASGESGSASGGLRRLHNLGFLRCDEERRYRVANEFFRRWLATTDRS